MYTLHEYTALVLFLSVLILCVKIYDKVTFLRLKRKNGCKDPPTFRHKEPFFGYDYWRRMQEASRRSKWLETSRALFEEYGKTYEVNDLGRRMIHTRHVENIRSVWVNDFKSWGLEPLREGIATPFFDRGINTTDGDFWRHSRTLIRPTFARVEVANLQILEKHITRFFDQVPSDGSVVDLQPLVACLFLDNLTEFLFGESMDSLLPEQRASSLNFMTAFDRCMAGLGARVRLGPLRFLHYDRNWLKAIKQVHQRIDHYIDRALDRTHPQRSKAEPLAERYVLLEEMARQTRDKDDLRSQIVAVFMPGRESIGFSSSNLLHILARRPDVWQKLRSEVLSLNDDELTFERLRSLTYLHSIINEGMRVYPTAAQSYRQALHDTTLPTGGGPDGDAPIYIRKGDTVMASIWGLHQDKDIWGEDAYEFRPERWKNLKHMSTYAPFLIGPRTCPAQQMVLTQQAYFLARFVRTFSCIESADSRSWTEARRLDFRSKHGVQVRLVRQDSEPIKQ